MKIAVFGGSGVVGRVLLPELVRRGHAIRAMEHRTPIDLDGAEVVPGSLTDAKSVADTIAGCDVVLQMTKVGESLEQVVSTSVHGTINVLDAIRSQPSVTQYLLTSSDAATGIWSHRHGGPVSHTTPPSSYPGYYSLSKVLEEVIVTEYHRNGPLPYTIARLSYVQQEDSLLRLFVAGDNAAQPTGGPCSDRYTSEQKTKLEAGERFVVLPCGADGQSLSRTVVQREDVVGALAAMVGRPAAIGQRFHVSGRAFNYQDACTHLAERLDVPVVRVVLPDAHSFEIDLTHEAELLDWAPKYDVIAMLDKALAWRAEHRA